MNFPIFPKEASTTAAHVDRLYFALIGMSVLVLIIVFGPMIVFLFRYRRGHRANRTALRISTWRIEVTWTVIPLLFTMGLFAWEQRECISDIEVPPPGTLEINVVGKQWMWKIQHQEGNREINELHIPIGRPVKLTLASEDVIHSFFVPAFRIKQDVVPGRFTTEWFTPTRVGDYHIFCAQYCGTSHSMMRRNRSRDGGNGISGVVACRRDGQHARANPVRNCSHTLGCSGCHEGNSVIRRTAAVAGALWLAGIADQWSGCHGGR